VVTVEAPQPPVVGGKGFVSARADAVAPPISLTASDGSGLRMLSLQAKAMVDDPIATTELELGFLNPRSEVIEGKLELALPPGAAIVRFAMLVGGTWQEAEVVERQKGREVYETFLHRQQDPALLEQEIGNRFSVRVFPIPAAGEVRLRVSYVQTFDEPTHPYRLALRGLPSVGELDARVGVRRSGSSTGSSEVTWTELRLERQRPREDLVVARDAPERRAWRSAERVIARVTIPAGDHAVDPPESIAILFDTSASRAVDFTAKVEQLHAVVEQLGRHVDPAAKLVVLPFDQSVGAAAYSGPLSELGGSDAQSSLLRRRPLGASNLELALLAAVEQRVDRVVVITDGMITAGKREPAALRAALQRMATAGTRRLDVVAGGDRRDDEVLRTLVTSELPQSGVVIDAASSPEAIALRLVRPTAPPTEVRIAGAKRVWPAVLRGVHAGDAALVYAEVEGSTRSLSVTLEPEGREPVQQRIDVVGSKDAAFTQAWVRADVTEQLAELAAAGDARDPTLRGQLTELSVEHRILNELTAFIVLESEADYARFGIERTHEEGDASVSAPSEGMRGSTSVGRTVNMEEFRNIPVGSSTSRDFVQVVESSASASRDSAGISLAGTTGAELEPRTKLQIASRPSFRRGIVRPMPAEVTLRSIRALGGLDEQDARVMGEAHRAGVEQCWFAAATHGGLRSGTMSVELHIAADGRVERVDLLRDRVAAPPELRRCMSEALGAGRFAPATGDRRARYTFVFRDGAIPELATEPADEVAEPEPVEPEPVEPEQAHTGNLAEVTRWLQLGEVERASSIAWAWRRSVPDDLMALVAVGEVAQAQGHGELAARAFGSIAELHPSDAAMLRFAAGRLEALGRSGSPLAIDVLEQAQRQRPDHPSSHQTLAWALARRGRFAAAFEALAHGYDNSYPDGRFVSARAELGEELRIIAAAWLRAAPKQRGTIEARLAELGLSIASEPSLRFVLTWETDVNDVDLHVEDGQGNRAWYSQPQLESGGTLLADVTTGFGPETFVIDGEPTAYPYHLAVDYFSRGPMGYGMGHVQVIHHDGKGNLELETFPFVTMTEKTKLRVGVVQAR